MKLVFLLTILASLAVLSLSAPLKIDVAGPLDVDDQPLKIDAAAPQKIDADEAMLEALASSLNVPNAGESELETNVAASSTKVRYIRIQSRTGRNNYLSISWVACYDLFGSNVCAGKSADASNRYSSPWGNPQTPLTSEVNTRTDAGNCFIAADTSDSNWWRVDLGSPGFELSTIKYRTRNDAPTSGQGYNLQIIMQDEAGNAISGGENNFITPASADTQTFKVNPLGYTGKYDDNIEPVIAMMTSLKTKITNALQSSKADMLAKKETKAKADAAYDDARSLDETISAKSKQEIEMLDLIVEKVHSLNGKK